MNRKRLLARGVAFGYAATAAQMFYSFASIPLALSHLSKAEFGMWSLITTLAMYLSMAEMGITNAFIRHLFECKEGKDPGKYGRLFTASTLALGGVGLVILIVGFFLSNFSAPWLRIPIELQQTYFKVLLGQTLLSSLTIGARMLGAPLYLHHRQDLSEFSQIVLFVLYYVVLHFAFKAGWGIYAMLANQAVGLVWGSLFSFIACFRLGYYPTWNMWGLPHRAELLSVWRYSRDQFFVQVGSLLVMGLPQLLISRLLGLEIAAAWAVFTRPFGILRQFFIKPFGIAFPHLCDMFVRGEMKKLTRRWCDISQMIMALSACGFVVAAANNSTFVTLWTHGKIHWDEMNNWLTALYYFVYGVAGLSYGIIGLSKSFGHTRFVLCFQFIATIAVAIPLARFWGLPGLILATTLPFVFGMVIFGLKYLGRITNQPIRPLATKAFLRPVLVLPLVVLSAWGCTHLTHLLPGYFGLLLSAGSGFALSLGIATFLGVSRDIRDEMSGMISRPIRRLFRMVRPLPASSVDVEDIN